MCSLSSSLTIVHISAQDPSHLTGGQGICILNICRMQLVLGFNIKYLSMRLSNELIDQTYQYAEGSFPVHRFSVSDSDEILTPYEGNEQVQLRRREEFYFLACNYIRSHYTPEQVILHLHGFYYIPLIAGALPEYRSVSTYHLLLSTRMERSNENGDLIAHQLKLFEAVSIFANKKIQAISPEMKSEILNAANYINDPVSIGKALNFSKELGVQLHAIDTTRRFNYQVQL